MITYRVARGKPDSSNADFRNIRNLFRAMVLEDSENYDVHITDDYKDKVDKFIRRSWYDYTDVLAFSNNGRCVGWMRYTTYDLHDWYANSRALDINYIYVVPDARSEGIGTEMLNRAKLAAAKEGIKRITLQVDSRNIRAKNLYTRNDFGDSEHFMEYLIDA